MVRIAENVRQNEVAAATPVVDIAQAFDKRAVGGHLAVGDVFARTMLRIPCGGIDDERNVDELFF